MSLPVIRAFLLSAALASITLGADAQIPTSPASGRWVRVDEDRRLYLDCIGKGSPTILMEAGFGDDGTPWDEVRGKLGSRNRVCTYDRAGMGRSDASPKPATAANLVDDLHRLVRTAGIKTPFVLVGHSRGGLYATLYGLTYGSDVAGMVLVDPSFAEQDIESAAVSAREAQILSESSAKQRGLFRRCELLAEAGSLSADDPAGCFSISPSTSAAERGETLRQSLRADYYRTLRSEFEATMAREGYGEILDRAKASIHPLGAMPLIVLTAGRPHQSGTSSPTDDAAASVVWNHGHDRLASYSSKGRSIAVPMSGHYIQNDQPQAVIGAIKAILVSCCAQP
jgi:pimeloyl-ACP methyl ester carboxylesterase